MEATLFTEARILIVDDQLANVRLLERLLRLWGYENVVGTTDGSEVVRLCSEAHADLVLLDLRHARSRRIRGVGAALET